MRDWTNFADEPAPTDSETINSFKEDGPLDWYVEGPGRRVGYDDLTAIDWVFEYTKERQRKRLLYSKGQGLLGHVQQILDGSHVWVVLVATGVAVGLIAACIDIATNWLGDLKLGYCKGNQGANQFYLNRQFCCWGHQGMLTSVGLLILILRASEFSECVGWVPWRAALGISSSGGGYVMEYIFFVMFSVRAIFLLYLLQSLTVS